jgi:superoxide reductase
MMERLNVLRCEICGNIVEVMHVGGGTLACCGQPMKLLGENTTDAATEKHVPVIERTPKGYKVTVGSVAHPMVADHHIQWIELIAGPAVHRRYLEPGVPPVAEFEVAADAVTAREHCNLHGLWKA